MDKLKELLAPDKYKQLEELDLLVDLEYMFGPSVLEVTPEDVATLLNTRELCSYIQCYREDPLDFELVKLTDAKASLGILYVFTDKSFELKTFNKLVDKCKSYYSDVILIYGLGILSDFKGHFILGLFVEDE